MNGVAHNHRVTMVRGHEVPWGSFIKALFGLLDFEHHDYSIFKEGTIDFDEVIDKLCSLGTQCKVSNDRLASFLSFGLCKCLCTNLHKQ